MLKNDLPFFYKKIKENSHSLTLVIESDVFIEGLVNAESCCGRLIDYLFDERFDIAVDDRIYLDYLDKLNKLGLEKKSIDCLLKFLKEKGKFVTAEKIKIAESLKLDGCRFLKFIEVGKSSKAKAVVILKHHAHFDAGKLNLFAALMTPEEVFEKLL